MRSSEEQELYALLREEAPSDRERSEFIEHIRVVANMGRAELTEFDKRRELFDIVRVKLGSKGEFFRTSNGAPYYFLRSERRVLNLHHSDFGNFLKQLSGLSETEHYYKFIVDRLKADVSETAPRAEVHAMAHFDVDSNRHIISDGAGGTWWRDRGGKWQSGYNGQDNIYFATEPDAESFYPDTSCADEENLKWFLQLFLLEDLGGSQDLTKPEMHLLLKIWLVQQLFPVFRKTRIIPTFLGPQGSGKTTAVKLLGKLLVGAQFEVTGVQENKEDNFVASVSNRTVVGLDNADSRVRWLADALARYATGQRFQIRKLYSNNEEVTFAVRAVLLITSRDPHFNRADVAERLLPLTFSRPSEYVDEAEIFDELRTRRNPIWGELLNISAALVDKLDLTRKMRFRFRMADYAVCGSRILGEDRNNEWKDILHKLTKAQSQFATEGDSITTALHVLLIEENGIIGPISTGELFARLGPIAGRLRLWFPETANGFGRMLINIKTAAETELDADIMITSRTTDGKRMVTIRKRGRLKMLETTQNTQNKGF